MAEISLDDQIQKDRQKQRMDRAKNKLLQQNKHNSRPRYQNDRNQRGGDDDRQDDRRNFKSKYIHKRFREDRNQRNDRNQRQDRGQRQDRNNEDRGRPQRTEKKDDADRQFRTLKVLGLSRQITNQDLYKLFATEGSLEKCLIEQDNFGRPEPTALVKYHSSESAKAAIASFNRHKVMNCVLTVEPYKNVRT